MMRQVPVRVEVDPSRRVRVREDYQPAEELQVGLLAWTVLTALVIIIGNL